MAGDLPAEQNANLQSIFSILEENSQILPETLTQGTSTLCDFVSLGDSIENLDTCCTPVSQDSAIILDASQTHKPNGNMTYFKETSEQCAKYLRWEKFIEKKLAKKGEKEFNIHNLCTDILDLLPENKPVKFDTLVRGKESSEVIRFFVSTLHLANNENIQFLDIPTKGLANDHLKLKLLTREIYEERFTDFQAPSEKGLQQKLAHFRSINVSKLQCNRSSEESNEVPTSSTSHSTVPRRNQSKYSKRMKIQ